MGIGVDKMIPITFKKLISFILISCLLSIFATAQAPPVPMTVVLCYEYSGNPIQGFEVTLTVEEETVKRITNEKGCVNVDVGTGSPDFKDAYPWTDTLKIDCGFTSCTKNYKILDLQTPYQEVFTLGERPVTSCPACPSCGSCGGGGSGVLIQCTEAKCIEDYPCEKTVCPKEDCPEVICKETTCPSEKVCEICEPYPDCEICEDKECPESSNYLIIAIILSVITGGLGGIYFTKNKTFGNGGGIKTYKKRDGSVAVHHKHSGIRGYHDPKTTHRDKDERHLVGQLYPQYTKDSSGNWMYKG